MYSENIKKIKVLKLEKILISKLKVVNEDF